MKEPTDSAKLNAFANTVDESQSFGAEAYLMEKICDGELDEEDVEELKFAASLLETACHSLLERIENGDF